MAERKATLTVDGLEKPVELPVHSGTLGPDVVDVRGLGAEGLFTFDPGFLATSSCESGITYIDGANGVLLHRGYPIEQLAKNSNFVELCYTLLFGELPNEEQYKDFEHRVRNHTMVHEQIVNFYKGFRRDAHPMAILSAVVSALSTFYQDSLDPADPQQVEISILRLLAKLPTIAVVFTSLVPPTV